MDPEENPQFNTVHHERPKKHARMMVILFGIIFAVSAVLVVFFLFVNSGKPSPVQANSLHYSIVDTDTYEFQVSADKQKLYYSKGAQPLDGQFELYSLDLRTLESEIIYIGDTGDSYVMPVRFTLTEDDEIFIIQEDRRSLFSFGKAIAITPDKANEYLFIEPHSTVVDFDAPEIVDDGFVDEEIRICEGFIDDNRKDMFRVEYYSTSYLFGSETYEVIPEEYCDKNLIFVSPDITYSNIIDDPSVSKTSIDHILSWHDDRKDIELLVKQYNCSETSCNEVLEIQWGLEYLYLDIPTLEGGVQLIEREPVNTLQFFNSPSGENQNGNILVSGREMVLGFDNKLLLITN